MILYSRLSQGHALRARGAVMASTIIRYMLPFLTDVCMLALFQDRQTHIRRPADRRTNVLAASCSLNECCVSASVIQILRMVRCPSLVVVRTPVRRSGCLWPSKFGRPHRPSMTQCPIRLVLARDVMLLDVGKS